MLVQSKSNLARLMATENLIIEQRKVPTAFFDVKNRILTVPILNGKLSPELYDLLLGHEVGHALETPEEGWHNSVTDLKVNRSILNVCEDIRIEKKIKRRYPGIRPSFLKGYKELMEMDFFGVKGQNLNNLNFIDRLNLYSKGGAAQGIDFSSEEWELVHSAENTETFDEVVQIALEIQKFMKENPDSQEKLENSFSLNDDLDFGSDSDYKDFDYFDDETQDFQVSKDTGSDNETVEENEVKKKKEKEGAGKAGSHGRDDNIESVTDNNFRQRESKLFESSDNKEIIYTDIPSVDLNKVIIPYKTILNKIRQYNTDDPLYNKTKIITEYNRFKSETNKVVSYLVKEFELKKNASQLAKAKVSKTGELNMSKIHEYRFTDDIFNRVTKVPNGKSHGLVMFIDWSGSMSDHINATIKQLLNLTLFCRKVNIPFEVYAFTTIVSGQNTPVTDEKPGEVHVNGFRLMNLFSSKMPISEYTEMSAYLLMYQSCLYSCLGTDTDRYGVSFPEFMALSGTPLNETIIAAFDLVAKFKSENKLDITNTIFLTDGDGGCVSRIYNREKEGGVYTASDLSPNRFKRSFLRDPVTHASVEIESPLSYRSSNASCQTKAFLTLLRQRIGGNIIGFFVCKIRDARAGIERCMNETHISELERKVTEFRRMKYTYLSNVGYDEYYFLRSDKLDTEEDSEFVVSSQTTRGLVSAFSKYTTSRVMNRVVLNRFINLIS